MNARCDEEGCAADSRGSAACLYPVAVHALHEAEGEHGDEVQRRCFRVMVSLAVVSGWTGLTKFAVPFQTKLASWYTKREPHTQALTIAFLSICAPVALVIL